MALVTQLPLATASRSEAKSRQGAKSAPIRRAMLLLCLMAVSTPLLALRCGTQIVAKGNSSATLTQRCGEPDDIQQLEKRSSVERYDAHRNAYYREYYAEPYEIWTYNFGPGRMVYVITIQDGIIQAIETEGRGY
jgi:hypothetical protein